MDTGADRPVAGLTLPATVDLGTASEDELLDLVEATARADARNAAIRAGALAGLHARVLRRVQQETSGLAAGPSHELEDLRLANRMVGGQVAHALGSSLWAADREVDRAVRLQVRPELGRVLAAGEVDVRQVDVLLEATVNLEPADADALVCSLLSTTQVLAGDPSMAAVEPVRELASGRVRLWDLVPGRLRQITRREAARLDPASLTRRHALARAGRRAAHTDLPDAMAAIHLIGPAEAVNGAWANLDATARQARSGRQAGPGAERREGRNLDQLRCDIALGGSLRDASALASPGPPRPTPTSALRRETHRRRHRRTHRRKRTGWSCRRPRSPSTSPLPPPPCSAWTTSRPSFMAPPVPFRCPLTWRGRSPTSPTRRAGVASSTTRPPASPPTSHPPTGHPRG